MKERNLKSFEKSFKKYLTNQTVCGIIDRLSYESKKRLKALKNFFKKLSKKYLTNTSKCGKIVKRSAKSESDGSLKIEQ